MRFFNNSLVAYLEQCRKPLVLALGLTCVALLGLIDYLTGYEFSFAIFYLMPVSLVAWSAGRSFGLVTSLASACVWLWTNQLAGETFSNPLVPYWNALTRLGIFFVVAVLFAELKTTLEHERELAHCDFLTSAFNARAFYGIASLEIDRARRYRRPFTVVYFDLDNFKSVNDQYGHNAGDSLLRTVVDTIKTKLRATDTVARLGGDEFAILLPETGSEAAQQVVPKIRTRLLHQMQENDWRVTFSIGSLTCLEPPDSVDRMIKLADDLMYSVKQEAKDSINYQVLGSDTPATADALMSEARRSE